MPVLFSTGSNARGQLASGDFEDLDNFSCVHLPSNATVLGIATGSNHSLLLLEVETDNGTKRELWGAGDGCRGQLGPGYMEKQLRDGLSGQPRFHPISLPVQALNLENHSLKFIAATWETSYVVLSCAGSNDIILSMGSNDFGDLGIGITGQAKTSGIHVISFNHINSANGSPLSDSMYLVNQLAAGQRHVVVLLEVMTPQGSKSTEQVIVGWGSARHGQLGRPIATTSTSLPTCIALPSLVQLPPDSLSGNDTIQSVSLGMQHTIFLSSSGRLIPLGSNRKHQLDLAFNPPTGNVLSINCTWNGTYAVVEKDDAMLIYSSGSNNHGQLGRGPIGQQAAGVGIVALLGRSDSQYTSVDIACGTEHVLALVTRRRSDKENMPAQEVWAWGWNEHGNLGTGTTSDAASPIRILPPPSDATHGQLHNIKGINKIWTGSGTSWISCQLDETQTS